jgi:tyrosyl-tRNA synthetase
VTSTKFPPVLEQLSYLKKGAAEVIRDEELRSKLENAERTGKPLRVYLGADPTAPDIHLGHTVVLRKLKHFQDMGHTAIFLIGDFSAMIGDPTGRSDTRPPLTREQVDANSKTYLDQVYKILDPKKTEVRYNSEWLDKMSSADVVRLCGHYRLARMLEREDFRSRLDKNLPISVHELLYPLLTAYDAVALESDVELGGTDQKFNILVHRDIQREFGQASEVALTMPILVGLDGERKMSKSLGNYVGITEAPGEMFGKLMSISDQLMWSYYELLTDFPWPVIVRLKEEVRGGTLHPMDAKMQLAHAIIAGFHGEEAAKRATEEFQRVFRDRQAPEQPTECRVKRIEAGVAMIELTERDIKGLVNFPVNAFGRAKLSALLVALVDIKSKSEAERLMKQGAVEIDGERVSDVKQEVDLSQPREFLLRAGKKKFLRIIVE